MVTLGSRSALVSLLRCLYEAQDLSLCGYVVSLLEGKLDLSLTSLSPVECLSVGYFLLCTCLITTGKFEVNLQGCVLDDYKIACVARELSKCCNDRHVNFEINLNTLDLYLSPLILHSGAITLLLSCCFVISLGISDHILEEVNLLSHFLATNSSLVKLNLSSCSLKITDSSGPALTEMLKVNKTLQTLDMSVNTGVADVGAFFIAEGLKCNNGLKHLELGRCGITAEGGNFIADALKVNRTLEHLSISCNSIGDTGFVHIAEALKSNHALKRLELANCRQTEKGLIILSASLVVNKCLQYLDIATKLHWYTQTQSVDQESLKEFVSSLQENLHLTRLRLGPARNAPYRKDIVEGEKSALNQVRRDKCLQEIEIDWVDDYIT